MTPFFRRLGKRAACGFLAGLMLFGLLACGKAESFIVADPGNTPSQAEQPNTEPEPDPEPEFDVTTSAYLTGLEKTADYPEGQRIAAVMVGNDRITFPHNGLSEASILVECIVDSWSITRLLAVYEDYESMPMVRPVRSARDQLYQIIAPSYPLFVHDGPGDPNAPVYNKMRVIDAMEFDFNASASRFVDWSSDWRIHEYTNGELLSAAVERNNVDDQRTYNSPIFNFVPYYEAKRIPEGGSATDVTIKHTENNRTGLHWNGEQWEISMNSSGQMVTLTDRNNDQVVAFDNALVLFAPMQLYNNSILVEVEYANGGVGYYFSEGCWEAVRWDKGSVGNPLRISNLYNPDESVQLNPGTTYIAVVRDTQAEDFNHSLTTGADTGGDLSDPVGVEE